MHKHANSIKSLGVKLMYSPRSKLVKIFLPGKQKLPLVTINQQNKTIGYYNNYNDQKGTLVTKNHWRKSNLVL